MAIKYRQELGRPLTYAEGDENFRTLAESIEKTLAEYPTLTAAMADDIPDGVVFLVNDGDDAGYWRRDTSNPEGAVFLRPFIDDDVKAVKDNLKVLETEFQKSTVSLVNIIENGDFRDGTNHWDNQSTSDLTVSGNTIKAIGKGQHSTIGLLQDFDKKIPSGIKFFVSFKIKLSNTLPTHIRAYIENQSGGVAVSDGLPWLENPELDQWYTFARIIDTRESYENSRLKINVFYPSTTAQNGAVVEIKEVILTDLTSAFGSGNEWGVAEVESAIQERADGWFNNYLTLVGAEDILNRIEDVRSEASAALSYLGKEGLMTPVEVKRGYALTANNSSRTVSDTASSSHVILGFNAAPGFYEYHGALSGFRAISAYDSNGELLKIHFPLPYSSSDVVNDVLFEAPIGTDKIRLTAPLDMYEDGTFSFSRTGVNAIDYIAKNENIFLSDFNKPTYVYDGTDNIRVSTSQGRVVFVPSPGNRVYAFNGLKPGKYEFRGDFGSSSLIVNAYEDGSAISTFKISELEDSGGVFSVPPGTHTTYIPVSINSWANFYIKELKEEPVKTIKSDLRYESLPEDLELIRGHYGGPDAVYKTAIKPLAERMRLSFKFKFNSDINIGPLTKIPLVKFVDKEGRFLKIHYRRESTDLLTINENRSTEAGKTIMTTYPVPKFSSGFGWETNFPDVPEDYKNFEFPDRRLPNFKPLNGLDAFYVWYKGTLKGVEYNDDSVSVDDASVQNDLIAKQDWKITINDTALIIFNTELGITETFTYSQYPTVALLYKAIEDKTQEGESLEDFETKYLHIGSDSDNDVGPSYPSDSLTKVTGIPFISTYPAMLYAEQDADTVRKDAFPFYASYAVDDSVHTFDLAIDREQNRSGVVNIDGQFANRYHDLNAIGENDYPFNGAAYLNQISNYLHNNEIDVYIGGDETIDADITVRDLLMEVNGYTDLEFSWRNGRIASDYTPFILASGGHSMYKGYSIPGQATGYDDEPVTPENPYPLIPAKYRQPRPGYVGDDYIPVMEGTAPSANFIRMIVELKKQGYVNVTLKQISDYMNNGIPLPRKSFYLQLDDWRTYAYGDLEIRRDFQSHGAVLNFCLGTSKYVDDNYVGDKTGQYWIDYYNDTNEHRLALQKRLRIMQQQGWETIMHGEDENTYVGKSSKEQFRALFETIRMSEYLEISTDMMTWAAGQYTVNSIKAYETYGLKLGLRASGEYPCLANPRGAQARGYMDLDTWGNISNKII